MFSSNSKNFLYNFLGNSLTLGIKFNLQITNLAIGRGIIKSLLTQATVSQKTPLLVNFRAILSSILLNEIRMRLLLLIM